MTDHKDTGLPVVPIESIERSLLANSSCDDADARGKILAMEAAIAAIPQVDLKVVHHFSKGLYARELHIPKGIVLSGEIHRFENLNIISKGEISVFTEDGGCIRLTAPCTIVSPPGTKRIGYAHEDTVWTTVHATEETDVDKIKDEVIAKDFDDPVLLQQVALLLKE